MTIQKSKAVVSASSHAGSYALPLVQSEDNILVEARQLHEKLAVKDKFATWLQRRIEKYGFEKGKDFFSLVSQNREAKKRGGHNKIDYHLTIDMAKELCMVEENAVGRFFRRYFIEAEKELRNKRLYGQAVTLSEIAKKVQTHEVDGRKVYHLRQVQRILGYSDRSGTSNIKRLNPGLISKFNRHCFIHEEYVKLMMTRATMRHQKEQARHAKPMLPIGFYSPQIQLELKERGLA